MRRRPRALHDELTSIERCLRRHNTDMRVLPFVLSRRVRYSMMRMPHMRSRLIKFTHDRDDGAVP